MYVDILKAKIIQPRLVLDPIYMDFGYSISFVTLASWPATKVLCVLSYPTKELHRFQILFLSYVFDTVSLKIVFKHNCPNLGRTT